MLGSVKELLHRRTSNQQILTLTLLPRTSLLAATVAPEQGFTDPSGGCHACNHTFLWPSTPHHLWALRQLSRHLLMPGL